MSLGYDADILLIVAIFLDQPTSDPTTAQPTLQGPQGEFVKTIFEAGSTLTNFGCTSTDGGRAINQDTEKWICTKAGAPHGFTVTPASGRMSIAHKLRVIAHNNCPSEYS